MSLYKRYNHHTHRVGTIAWNNSNIFASGSKDKSVIIEDVRQNNSVHVYKTAQ
jgi:WD40 repeat protein